MPEFRLLIECECEGIDTLAATAESVFVLTAACAHCGFTPTKPMCVDPTAAPANGDQSRDTSNRQAWKCSDCGREGSICITPQLTAHRQPGAFVIAVADIRGALAISSWDANHTALTGHTVAVVSEDADTPSTIECFFAIALSEGEWMDYDEQNGQPVSVVVGRTHVARV